jgi:ABC-type transport system involved in multi-copper enzyme maturation permease subunit
MLLILAVILIALSIWMAFVAHSYDVASMLRRTNRCPNPYGSPSSSCTGPIGQAQAILLILLALPCLIGLAMGTPLVAGELHGHTNRVAWTQSISRTRWLVTKWLFAAVGLLALSSLFELVVNWWFGHVHVAYIGVLLFSQGYGSDHIQPTLFNVTGVVPTAYVLFAFSLGVALGAVIRRTPWAIAATVVAYGLAALVMVTAVRPNLMPQTFVAYSTQAGTSPLSLGQGTLDRAPWVLGFGYRYAPGYKVSFNSPSADAAGRECQVLTEGPTLNPYDRCITDHHLQAGEFYQAADHYWPLQWREAAIYLGASIILFGIGLWSVRRWRS